MKRLSLLLLLAACAPMTEAERDAYQYKLADETNKYLERRAECERSGRIWYTNFPDRKRYKPRIYEMKQAKCIDSLREILM